MWAGGHYYQRWEVVKKEELDHLKKYRMQEEKARGEHVKQQEEAENRLLSQEEAEN